MQSDALNSLERRTAVSLALVFALRMLGLFMIMPIFAIYGKNLIGYSPLWVGFAIGAYGLTQALLQIPAGMLSDKFGRRSIIFIGLILFALGGLIAAYSDTIYGVTFGRALQGMGAISSAVLALAADVTREEQRPKAMAIIGTITSAGAVFGMLVVYFIVPKVINKSPRGDTIAIPALLGNLLKNPQLLRLDLGIFILHTALTAMFVMLPLQLQEMGFDSARHWQLYLPALLISLLFIVPMLIVGARKNMNKHFFMFSILLMSISFIAMSFTSSSLPLIFIWVILYFTAFNFLEASLPAFISMLSPAGSKGSAMGIYSTYQFFGSFCGGILGGFSYKLLDSSGLFLCLAGLMLLWFFISWRMQNPSKVRTHTCTANIKDERHAIHLSEQLLMIDGVLEVVTIIEEKTVYIKVNNQVFALQEAKDILQNS